MAPTSVRRRDGSVIPFDALRIAGAIQAAQEAVGSDDGDLAEELTQAVCDYLRVHAGDPVDLEEVQDAVILVLQGSTNYHVAQAYFRYRDQRERERRRRRADNQGESAAPNLTVRTSKGARRPWQRARLERFLCRDYSVSQKIAAEVACSVEGMLAHTNIDEIDVTLLMSLVDAALVQSGCHAEAHKKAPLRLSKVLLDQVLHTDEGGLAPKVRAGGLILRQWSLQSGYGSDVLRLYAQGLLWLDGLDDPLRGSEYTLTMDGRDDPWQIMAEAVTTAAEMSKYWMQINMILPPIIIGQLERDDASLAKILNTLGTMAQGYLYCDGRTPLLDSWPLQNKNIGIATFTDDFLIQGRLQELRLPMLSGPHLMQPGYKRRIAVRLALNARGLDEDHNKMDLMAMALVSAAKTRLQQLAINSQANGAEVRYTIFGLAPASQALEYLERQITQEGLRAQVPLARSTSLPPAACDHFGKQMREQG